MVKIENLTKRIKGNVLLKNVNIEINKGEFVVLLGKNGAGKSTLIKCLTGLYKIDEGEIYINGIKWTKKNDSKIKDWISYIPDKVNFDYNLTVEQNLIHHAALYHIKAEEAKMKIRNLMNLFEIGDKANNNINELSFGMQKKALIIRGLLSSPKIVIFDEPTIGLDPSATDDLLLQINKLKNMGITVIMSTQSLAVAETSNRVIFIEDGIVKDLNVLSNFDNSTLQSMVINVRSIEESKYEIIRNKLIDSNLIKNIEIESDLIKISLDKKSENIAECIKLLIDLELIIYSIKFIDNDFKSLYKK